MKSNYSFSFNGHASPAGRLLSGIVALLTLLLSTQVAHAQLWANVGAPDFSAGQTVGNSMLLDASEHPWVAYRDDANGRKATVMKYDGASWSLVGTAGFSAGVADYTNIAMDDAGSAYVVYRDSVNGRKATVMKFDGSSWVTVGAPGFSAGEADYTSIAIGTGGVPYVAYSDWGNGQKVTVMKFNGSAWVNVGTPGFSTSTGTFTRIAIDGSGTPYVVFRDYSLSQKVTVMKFAGTSWASVGSPGFSAREVFNTSIAIDPVGSVFVAYSDSDSRYSFVMKYSGTAWSVFGGGPVNGVLGASTASLILPSPDMPMVVITDSSHGWKASVMAYMGTSWLPFGTAGFSNQAEFTSIACRAGGLPYIVYSDVDNSGKATVMRGYPEFGVNAVPAQSDCILSLAPNPCKDIVAIRLASSVATWASVVITDVLGRKIKELNVRANETTDVQLSAPPGIYRVIATVDGKKVTAKLVLE
jgi:hypothetical protein